MVRGPTCQSKNPLLVAGPRLPGVPVPAPRVDTPPLLPGIITLVGKQIAVATLEESVANIVD